MNALEACRAALLPLKIPIAPDLYTGAGDRYLTYNYAFERGEEFGDDRPEMTRNDIQVHFVCPLKENYIKTKNQIRDALFENGFSFPQIVRMDDQEQKLRHIIYECEFLEDL